MKKIIATLAALLVASMAFVSCGLEDGSATSFVTAVPAAGKTDVAKSNPNVMAKIFADDNGYIPQVGDTLVVVAKVKCSQDATLYTHIIDRSAKAGYWGEMCCDWTNSVSATKDKEVEIKKEFKLTKAAMEATTTNFCVTVNGSDADTDTTVTFTAFSVTRK